MCVALSCDEWRELFTKNLSVKSSDSELVTHKLFSVRICINRFAMIGNRIDCRDMLRLNSLEGDRRNVIIALNLSECYRGCSFNRLGRSLAVFEIGPAAGQFEQVDFKCGRRPQCGRCS